MHNTHDTNTLCYSKLKTNQVYINTKSDNQLKHKYLKEIKAQNML